LLVIDFDYGVLFLLAARYFCLGLVIAGCSLSVADSAACSLLLHLVPGTIRGSQWKQLASYNKQETASNQ
jgi:hypothetical protein